MTISWDLVGGNPAPGDPGWVAQQAKLISNIGSDAQDSHQQLSSINEQWSNSDWSGHAADMFRTNLGGTVVPDLVKLSGSYSMASTALHSFASTLTDLQQQAMAALQRADQAQQDFETASARAQGATDQISAATSQVRDAELLIDEHQGELVLRLLVPGVHAATDATVLRLQQQIRSEESTKAAASQAKVTAQYELNSAQNAASDAKARLNASRSTIQEIRAQFDSAASTARSGLEEASNAGLHNLSFLGRLERDASGALALVGKFDLKVAKGLMDGVGRMMGAAARDIDDFERGDPEKARRTSEGLRAGAVVGTAATAFATHVTSVSHSIGKPGPGQLAAQKASSYAGDGYQAIFGEAPSEYWCGDFAALVLSSAGLQVPKGAASVASWIRAAGTNGSGLVPVTAQMSSPVPGDAIAYVDSSGKAQHIGVVTGSSGTNLTAAQGDWDPSGRYVSAGESTFINHSVVSVDPDAGTLYTGSYGQLPLGVQTALAEADPSDPSNVLVYTKTTEGEIWYGIVIRSSPQ